MYNDNAQNLAKPAKGIYRMGIFFTELLQRLVEY